MLSKDEEVRKDFRWTNKLITKVYNYLRSNRKKRRRRVEANLFVGEWTKYLEGVGGLNFNPPTLHNILVFEELARNYK